MRKTQKLLLLFFMGLLPLTRLFRLKAILLNLAGFKVARTARITSSIKILGVENVTIGKDTFIGHNTTIIGSNNTSVTIGSYCDISSQVTFVTGSHEVDVEGLHIAGKGIGKDIVIEYGVWIGINSTILSGVIIGQKSIVAAGAVVIKDVPSYTMVAGNPAIIKKTLKGNIDA